MDVIPVVIGTSGTVRNRFEKWIKRQELELTVRMMQKPRSLARILQKELGKK